MTPATTQATSRRRRATPHASAGTSASSSSARASPASAPRSGWPRTAATTTSWSTAAARSAAPGATTPTRARPATSRRTCTRTRSSSTPTGRARSRRSRRSRTISGARPRSTASPTSACSAPRSRSRRWDEDAEQWLVDTTNGTFSADVLVSAVGALCEPQLPDIKGIETFQGKIFHSSRWDHGADLEGKRVALIGTGASAIQIGPAIIDDVAHLDVYQRTAPWVMPRRDRAYTAVEKFAFKNVPFAQRARARRSTGVARPSCSASRSSPRSCAPRRRWQGQHRQGDHRPGAAREGHARLPDGLQAHPDLQRLVPDARARQDRPGHRRHRRDPRERDRQQRTGPCARWTRSSSPPASTSPTRRRTTRSSVSAGARSARCGASRGSRPTRARPCTASRTCCSSSGPNCGLGHSSMVYMAESHLNYLSSALKEMDRHGLATFEVRADRQREYNAELQHRMKQTIWTTGGCSSWYLDAHGNNTTLWPLVHVPVPRAHPALRQGCVPDDARACRQARPPGRRFPHDSIDGKVAVDHRRRLGNRPRARVRTRPPRCPLALSDVDEVGLAETARHAQRHRRPRARPAPRRHRPRRVLDYADDRRRASSAWSTSSSTTPASPSPATSRR